MVHPKRAHHARAGAAGWCLADVHVVQQLLLMLPATPSSFPLVCKAFHKSFATEICRRQQDFSLGEERTPIRCVNTLHKHDPGCDPPFPVDLHPARYITRNVYDGDGEGSSTRSATCPEMSSSHKRFNCLCDGVCFDECPCMALYHTGDSLRFSRRFACSSACSCGALCQSREIQIGLRTSVFLHRHRSKGWSLISSDFIAKGNFVIEFVGEVISSDEASVRRKRYENAHHNYMITFNELRSDGDTRQVPTRSDSTAGSKDVLFSITIDPTTFGNAARYINHSCDANLTPQLVELDDASKPRLGMFANRDIRPFQELSFDYGSAESCASATKCMCGADACRGFLPHDIVK